MTTIPSSPGPDPDDSPLAAFSRCHLGILNELQASNELPELAQAAARARQVAAATVDLFQRAVLPHHAEEETELFPAVLRSAHEEEAQEVRTLVAQLTAEHRAIEAQWRTLAPAVKKLARGEVAQVDGDLMEQLVRSYLLHARTEESRFLPLAERILARDSNHMAALGLALHMRHAPLAPGYI